MSAGFCKRISVLAQLEKQPATQITLHSLKLATEMRCPSNPHTTHWNLCLYHWCFKLLHTPHAFVSCFTWSLLPFQLKYTRVLWSCFPFFLHSVASIKSILVRFWCIGYYFVIGIHHILPPLYSIFFPRSNSFSSWWTEEFVHRLSSNGMAFIMNSLQLVLALARTTWHGMLNGPYV